MKAEEFERWVQDETDYSVLDCADYDANNGGYIIDVESIFSIAKAYHQSKVESISIEQIETILPSTLSIKEIHKKYLMKRFLKRLKQVLNNA